MNKPQQLFKAKSKISRGSWTLVLPNNWSIVDEDGEVVSVAASNGVGVLQLSSYFKDDLVTDSDLVEFAEKSGRQRHNLNAVELGEFTGLAVGELSNNVRVRFWFLRCRSTMLFATYNCEADCKGTEDEEADAILSSLTYS